MPPFMIRPQFATSLIRPMHTGVITNKLPTQQQHPMQLQHQSATQAKPTTSMAQPETRLLNLRVVRNMTKNGKLMRFSAMVAAGTGTGGIGIGQATHASAQDAIMKAGRIAARNVEYFERWEGRTLFHDDVLRFKASKIYVRPAPPNTGRRVHPAIAEMCRCMGIADIGGKVHGSRHPMNVAQGFLELLRRQKTPEQVAADSGMRIVDVLRVYEGAQKRKL